MKKLFVLFGIFAFLGGASFAYYYENETLYPETMKAQGYSNTMILVTDKTHAFNEGIHSNYQRKFQRPKRQNFLGRSYYYLKNYVDPLQDDGLFGEHQINFSNTWTDETTKYATPEKSTTKIKGKKYGVENL